MFTDYSYFEYLDGSKTGQGRRGYLQEGAWDAIHVIQVGYTLAPNISTIMCSDFHNILFICSHSLLLVDLGGT